MYKLKSNKDFFIGNHIQYSLDEILSVTNQPNELSNVFTFLLNHSLILNNKGSKTYLRDNRASYSILFLFDYHVRLYLYDVLYHYEKEIASKYKSPYEVIKNIPSIEEVIVLSTDLLNAFFPSITNRYEDTASLNRLFNEKLESPSKRSTLRDRLEYILNYFDIDKTKVSLYDTFMRIAVDNSRYYAAALICDYFSIPSESKQTILLNVETWLSQNTQC